MRKSIAGMVKLDAAVAVILTVQSLVFLNPLMHFMNIPESIFAGAYSYIAVICAGMAATICYNMFAGIMRAVGKDSALMRRRYENFMPLTAVSGSTA